MAMDIYEHSVFVYLKDLYLAHGGDSWEQVLKARREMKALSDADQEQWRYLDNLIREYLRIEFDVSGLLSEHGRKLKG
jgi:Zn-dependent M16 (insulinase) family peptidase